MDQYIGKLLDNRYEILEIIGTGGMARVYKARCHRLNRLVAIKILREDLAQDAEFRRRFQRHVVPVNTDEPSGGELRGNAAGMPRAAQGSVHVNAVGLDGKPLDTFLQQHGNMMKFTHRPIASRDASSFSGVRFSRSKSANSFASQISACPARPTIMTSRSIPA